VPPVLETDPRKIASLAEEREEENWEFRSFLKGCDDGEIDAAVCRIYARVSGAIDCTNCGNCCREVSPVLGAQDVERLSAGLGFSVAQTTAQYLVPSAEEPGRHQFRERPCPFLKGSTCSVYDHRPSDCRSFPHLDKEGFTERLMGVVANYGVCPIVFNVYEALKQEFR